MTRESPRVASAPDQNGPVTWAPPPTVIETLLDVARRAPHAVAVEQGGEQVTYAQLLARAAQVRAALLDAHLAAGSVVAIGGRVRSPDFIAAMIGALAARGVMFTIDPDAPAARSAALAAEVNVAHVVWVERRGLPAWAREREFTVLHPGRGEPAGNDGADVDAAWSDLPARRDAAYVFFTSGSTGAPKGVLGGHHGLAHFAAWQRGAFAANASDRCAALTRVSFDVMLRDVFLPLTSGACLLLPDVGDERPDRVLRWLRETRATWVHAVPSLANAWMANASMGNAASDVRLPDLRATFFAGEPLSDTLVRRWRRLAPSGLVANLYGPTETTLAKFCGVVAADPPAGTQPVGTALPDTQAIVLSDDGRPCDIGEMGEIVIRTPYRTLGYINERAPAPNAAPPAIPSRFRANPFTTDPNDIVYYTGDRGRWRADGQLDVCGRLDDQVKLHGVRIEPAEVERVLVLTCGLRDAVVLLAPGVGGAPQLAACVVAGDQRPSPAELRAALELELPRGMVPTTYAYIDAVPLTGNGKRDRRALAGIIAGLAGSSAAESDGASMGPATMGARSDAANTEPRAPRPEHRRTSVSPEDREGWVVDVWREELRRDDLSAGDDVFTLGATSLAALTVAARLSDAFGREMPPGAIVDRPTPREQAQWFEEVERYLSRQDRDHVIHCRPEPRQTLFAFPPLLGYGLAFHALAPHLTTHALHAFDFPENADPVETLAAAVLDAAPMGPYTFVGYSAGGNLAFDVAVALERRGAAIAAIVMLDSERREQVHPLADADIEDIVWGNIENLAGLMRESEQFRDFTRNEFLVQRMAAKMRAYLQYESVTANTGRTAADIHFIYSDDRSACTSWRDATTGAFTLRRGSGGHLEMTIGEHAERNARILGKILGNEPRGAVPE